MIDPSDVLFVGWGNVDGVSHYRTVLPARSIGAEWVVIGMTGQVVQHQSTKAMHKVIIVQNCWMDWQLSIIRSMREKGAKVLVSVDDWIKTIGKMTNAHAGADYFKNKKVLETHYKLLREADGIIVSTPWLERKMRNFHKNVVICRNMIDLERYDVPDVEKDFGVVIGWSGGTGHLDALRSIKDPLLSVMRQEPNVRFLGMGEDPHKAFGREFADRMHYIGWQDIDLYPRDMRAMDVIIAPAYNNDFYRAKSQLRYYEACALGIPIVAHPMYDEIVPGQTGLVAFDNSEWESMLLQLVRNKQLRLSIGKNMRKYAEEELACEQRSEEWREGISRAVCDVLQTRKVSNDKRVPHMLQATLGQRKQAESEAS